MWELIGGSELDAARAKMRPQKRSLSNMPQLTLYAERAAEAARTLKEAGAVRVWLAGKGSYDGVDANIFAGCNAVETLETTLRDLGVAE